jgi:hypothetical protein
MADTDDAADAAFLHALGVTAPVSSTLPGTTVVNGSDAEFMHALKGGPPAGREGHQGWGEWAWGHLKGMGQRVAENMTSHEAHYAKRPEDVAGYDMQGAPLTAEGVEAWKKGGYAVYPQPPTLAEKFKDVPAMVTPGAAREFATGATFGFEPRMEAGVRGLLPGSPGYGAELEKVRAEKEAWEKAHPELAGALEFSGAAATPMKVAKPLLGVAPGLARQFLTATGVGGTAAGLNAAGHTYGNPNDTALDVLGQQVGNAMMAAPVGMAVAGVSVPILNQIFRGAGMAGRFLTSGGQSKNADRIIAEKASKDNINLGDLEENLPATVSARARKLNDPNDINDARRMIEGGATPQDVAQQYGVSVKLLQQRLRSEDAVPMNIVDLAKMERPGAGSNIEGLVRAGARIPGENKAVAVEKLTQRQLEQQQRAGALVRAHWGSEDYDTAANNLAQKIKTTNDTLYNAARATDRNMTASGTPLNIDSTLTQFESKWQNSMGPVGRAIKDGVQAFRPANGPIRSIDDFMQAKADFDALLAANRDNKPVLRELMGMKSKIYDDVRQQNPQWWDANVKAADGFAAERAMQLGQEIALGTNRNTRDILKRVSAMSPDELELARLSAGDTWQRHLNNQGEFNDITRRMRINAMRPVYEAFLGKKSADKFWLGLKREGTTTQGFNTLASRGSPTTPDAENIADLRSAGDLMGDILSGNPMGILGRAYARVRHGVTEQNATDIMNKLLETDPELVRRTLRSSGAAQSELGAEAQRRVGRTIGAVSGATDLTTGHIIDEMQKRRNEAALKAATDKARALAPKP